MDIAHKISKAVDFNGLGFSHHTDFFFSNDEGQKFPRDLVKVLIYCAPCLCLISTAIDISRTLDLHLEYENPR